MGKTLGAGLRQAKEEKLVIQVSKVNGREPIVERVVCEACSESLGVDSPEVEEDNITRSLS
jgi:hypothetical protein